MLRGLCAFQREYFGTGVSAYYIDNRGKWSVDYLIRCSQALPIVTRDLLDINFLYKRPWKSPRNETTDRSLSIKEILDHIARIERAGLDYPILLDPEDIVLDGFHRLAKRYLQGIMEVPTRQFLQMPRPDLEVYKPELWDVPVTTQFPEQNLTTVR